MRVKGLTGCRLGTLVAFNIIVLATFGSHAAFAAPVIAQENYVAYWNASIGVGQTFAWPTEATLSDIHVVSLSAIEATLKIYGGEHPCDDSPGSIYSQASVPLSAGTYSTAHLDVPQALKKGGTYTFCVYKDGGGEIALRYTSEYSFYADGRFVSDGMIDPAGGGGDLQFELEAGGSPEPNEWHELTALPYTWIQQMSFVSARVGFAAGGNGQVLRTKDGGVTWTPVIDTPHPYYWNGVHAVTPNDIVATASFNSDEAWAAVIRWSHDGGDTWSDDLVLSNTKYVIPTQAYFWNSQTGFVATFAGAPNLYRTTSGGLQLTDWSAVTISPDWFGPEFSALPNGNVRMSGIQFCESTDFAASWNCRDSIDPMSDYATFFIDDKHGWVGGGGDQGELEGEPPNFVGYVHVTDDGGATWSDRTLEVSWPIRSIVFVNKRDGWAMGGYAIAPVLPNAGGAYVSHDGGVSWTLEADLGIPPQTCATADYHLFCVAIDNVGTSHVYERDFDHIAVTGFGD